MIDRNASLIFRVYAADVELAKQSVLLQKYLMSKNEKDRQDFEESKVNMEAVFSSLDKELITPEGKKLAKVRTAVDAWHLSAMQGLKNSPGERSDCDCERSRPRLEAEALAAEQEINAYVRFLRGRMHERTEENLVIGKETQQFIVGGNVAVVILATGLSLWLWRRISRAVG